MIPMVLQKESVRAMKKLFSRAQMIKGFFKGDLHAVVVKGYANRLIKRWERFNKDFYYKLKHELYGELNTRISKITEKFKNRQVWD